MVVFVRVNEAMRLFYVHFVSDSSLKEGVVDVKLLYKPFVSYCDINDQPHDSGFGYWTKHVTIT